MYHHVATYLSHIQAVVPYLYQANRLVGHNVEYKNVQRVVACIYSETFQPVVFLIQQQTDVVGHEEA